MNIFIEHDIFPHQCHNFLRNKNMKIGIFVTLFTTVVSQQDCWIMHRMPKAGSTTTYKMLETWANEDNIVLEHVRDLPGEREKNMPFFQDGHYDVISSFSAPGMMSLGLGMNCKWFTMLRHPAPRLVSAYLYCKSIDHDVICGKQGFDFRNGSFIEFAKFWSNFTMRQFVLAFVKAEDILASPSVQKLNPNLYGLFKVPAYTEELFTNRTISLGGDPTFGIHDIGMMKFLEPAMEILESYAAVGIMEHFDESMKLYDAALGLPGMEWEKRNTKVYNTVRKPVASYQDELLNIALTDPRIREYMWLDLVLYDYAKSLFEKSLVEYDIM